METLELTCPACGSSHRQTKEGKTAFGSQRDQCQDCKRSYPPVPKPHGNAPEPRPLALRLYLEGNNFRRIGRLVGVAPQTVINWVNAYEAALKAGGTIPPQPATVETAELDELWTFVGSKKTVLRRDARRSRHSLSACVFGDVLPGLGDASIGRGSRQRRRKVFQ